MENINQNTDELLLSVDNIKVNYITKDETVEAVNGVSFKLNKGQTIGLVGETGAGKTTIARTILRILPTPPAKVIEGEVEFQGKKLFEISEEEMRKIRGDKISMVFQDPMTALNPVKRVGWQVAEAIRYHQDVSKKEADEKAIEMFRLVGISPDRFREYPHQFSGGMKQRVVIAMALACNPDLLIADEPTSALDVTIQAQVLEMISDLQKRQGTAMILITHDFGIVAKCCDTVAVVYAGEIVEYGTLEQVFEAPTHPYTQGLFDAIPKMTTDVDRLSPIFGAPPDPTNLSKGCKFAPRCKYATEACNSPVPVTTLADGHQFRCNRQPGAKEVSE
ncbi:MAG: ABC transporter ATP-binding protein [Lachnospiraceae bacterium]|nr:ABC transporter ATP-binding protein [Lachnospiraceae bacterium]